MLARLTEGVAQLLVLRGRLRELSEGGGLSPRPDLGTDQVASELSLHELCFGHGDRLIVTRLTLEPGSFGRVERGLGLFERCCVLVDQSLLLDDRGLQFVTEIGRRTRVTVLEVVFECCEEGFGVAEPELRSVASVVGRLDLEVKGLFIRIGDILCLVERNLCGFDGPLRLSDLGVTDGTLRGRLSCPELVVRSLGCFEVRLRGSNLIQSICLDPLRLDPGGLLKAPLRT